MVEIGLVVVFLHSLLLITALRRFILDRVLISDRSGSDVAVGFGRRASIQRFHQMGDPGESSDVGRGDGRPG